MNYARYFSTTLLLLILAIAAQAQTRGAIAVTSTSNQDLGDKQFAVGALGALESRTDRFGFAATGTFGTIRKNSGGSGMQYSFAGEGRYFAHKDFFLSAGLSQSGYSVKSFSKSATAITGGIGISREVFTLSGQYGRDVSGVTRRSLFTGRAQVYAVKKVLIGKPYFDAQVSAIRFNQHGVQTGASLRFGIGFWFGAGK